MRLKRTKPISPSKLGIFDACKLRYLAETEGVAGKRLSAGPAANMGIAVHEAIELLIAYPDPDVGLVRRILVERLSEQFSSPQKSSRVVNSVFERFGASGIFPQARILLLCGYVKDVLRKMPRHFGPPKTPELPTTTTTTTIGQTGIEKWGISESLAMAGRIDYSYLDEVGSLHIVDFKTGRVSDDEGLPKTEYLNQIAAYGLILRETISVQKVILHLEGPRGNWEGELTSELENRVKYLARTINRSLPVGQIIEAQDIATLGKHCGACSVRPTCSKYLEVLSDGGGESQVIIANGDLFGNVIETKVADGLVKIRLECSAAKRVTVVGIPEELWINDDTVFMFGLRTKELLGRSRYFANYPVLDVSQPQSSAFSYLAISGGVLS